MQTLVDLGPGPAVPHPGIGKVAVLRNLSEETADLGCGRHLLGFWPGFSPGASGSRRVCGRYHGGLGKPQLFPSSAQAPWSRHYWVQAGDGSVRPTLGLAAQSSLQCLHGPSSQGWLTRYLSAVSSGRADFIDEC